jgi:hypothetical protein
MKMMLLIQGNQLHRGLKVRKIAILGGEPKVELGKNRFAAGRAGF